MDVVVIGGGPAGMLAAISASNQGDNITIIEKMNALGKKLCITGKGRCNITSSLPIDEFIKNIPGNGKFLYSAFQNFTNQDIINLLKEEGLETKVERGNRVFPVTDRASDVRDALIRVLKKQNVKIITNAKVEEIEVENGKVTGVKYKLNSKKEYQNLLNKDNLTRQCKNENFEGESFKKETFKNELNYDEKTYILKADKVILATGGKSYPLTGSTGDGYKMAKKLDHTITEIRPSLVALKAKQINKNEDEHCIKEASDNQQKQETNVAHLLGLETCQKLQGLSLKNVGLKIYRDNKQIYEDFGEMLFTHFGVSGPIILSGSAHLVRGNMDNVYISIDLKPALDEAKLDERILRDFSEEKNKEFKNSLNKLLPQKLITVVVDIMDKIICKNTKIDTVPNKYSVKEVDDITNKEIGKFSNKKVNSITKEERHMLVKLLKNFNIAIEGFRPVEEAIVTAGGVNIKEINPKTMESKIVKGLYFAGEIIDVDAYTGGFNLQIAYSTGYTAGLNQQ